jgi:hypothetical protein
MNQLPSVNTTIFLKNKSIIQCPGYMFRLNSDPSSGLQIQAKIYKMRLILGSHDYYNVWVILLFCDAMLDIQISSYSIAFLKVIYNFFYLYF